MMHATTNAAPGVEHTAFCNSRTWLVMHSRCENYVLALVCQLPATSYQPGSYNLAEPCLSQCFKGHICNMAIFKASARCVISLRLLLFHPTLMSLISLGIMVFSYSRPSKSPRQAGVRPRSASLPQTNGRTTKRPSSARKAATLIETVSLAPRRPRLSRRFGRPPILLDPVAGALPPFHPRVRLRAVKVGQC